MRGSRCVRRTTAASSGWRRSRARRLTRRLLGHGTRGGSDQAISRIPSIVLVRCDLLARLLAVTDPEAVVWSCVRESGLVALTLLVPRGVGATAGPQPIDDIAALLDASQEACDPRVALDALCRRLRDILGAAYVGVHGLAPPFTSLTSPGGRADQQLIARIAETGCAVAPEDQEGGLDGGAPIRVKGRTVGVLVTRFRRNGLPAGERWWSLSAAAAGLAGPLTDSRLVQRVVREDSPSGLRDRRPIGVDCDGETSTGTAVAPTSATTATTMGWWVAVERWLPRDGRRVMRRA